MRRVLRQPSVSPRPVLRRVLLAVVAIVSAIGLTRAPDTSASGGLYELGYCPVDGGIAPNDIGAGVTCLQFALALRGLYAGSLSGIYDEATAEAIRQFQTDSGLNIDGLAGRATLEALGVFSGKDNTPPAACKSDAPLVVGSRGPGVQCLQEVLFDLGFLPFPPNGVFDADTGVAVTSMQNSYVGLNPNGIADQRTLAALGIWSGVSVTGALTGGPSVGAVPAGPWPSPIIPGYPEFGLTPEGLPLFGNRRPCTVLQADIIAAKFAEDGANTETQQWAVYVATREGGCDHTTVNFNLQTRDDSHCTFQLNALAGLFNANAPLGRRGWTVDNVKASLENCADAASDLWVFCGRSPWTPPAYGCDPPWETDLGSEGDA